MATPSWARTVDRQLEPQRWHGQGTTVNLDQDLDADPANAAVGIRDAAAGVGVGREERFSVVAGALQWSLQQKGLRPLDYEAVDRLHHLAIHQGSVGWEAAMRCCHKLNKAVWQRPVGDRGGGVRNASAWLNSNVLDQELRTYVDEALRNRSNTQKQ